MGRMKEREQKKGEVNEVQAVTAGNIKFTQEGQRGNKLAFWILLRTSTWVETWIMKCLIPITNKKSKKSKLGTLVATHIGCFSK